MIEATPWDDKQLINKLDQSASVLGLNQYSKAETKVQGGVAKFVSNLGVDPRISGAVLPLVGLTIKDPKLIAKGVKQGSARSPEWAKQTREFDMRVASATDLDLKLHN